MDSEEFGRQIQALAAEMNAATARWESRAEKLERGLERARQKLQQIQVAYKALVDALWASYTNSASPDLTTSQQKRRTRRGSMDAPIFKLICDQFHDEIFTVHDVIAAWNAQYPQDHLSTSTVRGVLNRHVSAERLREVEKGGRGNGNLEYFALAPGAEAAQFTGGVSIDLAH